MPQSYRIAEIARAQGVQTAAELARRTGLTKPTVTDLWNNRDGTNPTIDTLEKIAATLGVQVSELLKEEGQQ